MKFSFRLDHINLSVTVKGHTKEAAENATVVVDECCDVESIGAPVETSDGTFVAVIAVRTGNDLHKVDEVLSAVHRIANT